jgi:GT2 family glycosyltransferase
MMRGHTPSLSVVIPSFNNEPVLRRAVESWRDAAVRHDVEIVVVADGNRDGTRAWLDALSATAWGRQHLQWIELNNAHELRCTNAGFAVARGPLLAAWQDDMFLCGRWMVPELLRAFARHPDMGLLSLSRGLNNVPAPGPVQSWDDLVDWKRLQSTIGRRPWNWFRLQEVDSVIRPWIVRRACLDAVGPLDEAFVPTEWDESDLAYRIRQAGWHVATCGYERLGGYAHLGSSTLGELSDAYKQRVLKNGQLFHRRWDATIARDHARARRTWWRPQTACGWINTVRGIASAVGFGGRGTR